MPRYSPMTAAVRKLKSFVSIVLEIYMNAAEHVFESYAAVKCKHSCGILPLTSNG